MGIDHYDPAYGPGDLLSCINDANGIRDALELSTSGGSSSGFTTLTDSSASKTVIRNSLANIASVAAPGDIVVYFQSSHGGQHSSTDTFLCSYDANYEDEEFAQDLSLFGDGVKIFVIIDACHSGGMYKSTSESQPQKWDFAKNVMREYTQLVGPMEKGEGPSIAWMTACDYDEFSSAGSPFSLFAGYLYWGIWFADKNGDAVVTFQELFDYAYSRTVFADSTQNPQSSNIALLSNTVASAVGTGNSDLQSAVELTSGAITSFGDDNSLWTLTTAVSHDGVDSACSGSISHNEASTMAVSLVGPGELSFRYKISTESSYDWFYFYVDDMLWNGWSGQSSGFTQISLHLGPGKHLVRWIYDKDFSVSSGDDCVWIDNITWTSLKGTPGSGIVNAIDDSMLPVLKGGDADWVLQSGTTHDGSDAAQNNTVGDNEWSWFMAEIIGPGDLSFWWKCSSEKDKDIFHFSIDDEEIARISGSQDWTQENITIREGIHVIGWGFSKNYGTSSGADCGWVDEVVWTGDYDTDSDGMPNSWEIDCGLSATESTGNNGASGDPDNDGMNNIEEYIADTLPQNGSSLLVITNLVLTPEGMRVEWQGGNSVYQCLEYCDDLSRSIPEWNEAIIKEPPTLTYENWEDESLTGETSRVYRIRAWRP